MSDCTVVITMAGRGSRFYDAGYTVPKYAICALGRTLFDWSLTSLTHFLSPHTRLVFVCLKQARAAEFILPWAKEKGLAEPALVELGDVTDGQATSAYLSRHQWLPGKPVLIYNIDTFVLPDALRPDDIPGDAQGWVPCMRAPGDHWSFFASDSQGWATEVAEKKRISDNASVGLYWFANADVYCEAYEGTFARDHALVGGERYIAPMYATLVGQGARVAVHDIPPSTVYPLGTPAELDAFLSLGKPPYLD